MNTSGTFLSATQLDGSLNAGWKPGQPLPSTLKLFRKGDNPSAKGVFRVTDKTISALAAYQTRVGRQRVQIDFEHNTVPGSAEYERTHEPRDIAGQGAVAVLDDGSIALTDIRWTSLGQQKAEHFEDLSPVPVHAADGEVIGLHSVALVKCGATYGLSLLSADDIIANKETTMTPEAIQALLDKAMQPILDRISALEQAGKGDAPEKVQAQVAEIVKAEAADVVKAEAAGAVKAQVAEAVKTEVAEAVKTEVAGAVKAEVAEAVKTETATLSAGLSLLTANDASREKDHLIRCAMLDGRNVAMLKPETVTALSVDALKAQLDALTPGEIPLERRTLLNAADAANRPPRAPTEQQGKVATMLGLDPAKVEWHPRRAG